MSHLRLDVVLLALLPTAWLLANHYPPWVSAWQDGFALAMLLLGMAFLSRPASLPRTWALWCVVALGSVVVQVLNGQIYFGGDAWIVTLYLLAFALALAAGSTLVESAATPTADRLNACCTGLVLAAIASVGVGFAQWAGTLQLGIFGVDLPPGGRPFGNLAQPNLWCSASFMGLGAALVLYEGRRIGTGPFSAAAIVLLAGMVASGSRTAWLQVMVLTLLVLFLRRRMNIRLTLPGLALGLVIFTIGWLSWPSLNEAMQSAAAARGMADQAQAGVRLPLWTAMFQAIAERPALGFGWQQMVLAQQEVALSGPLIQRHFEHAHNLVLDLWIWTGLPTGTVLIVLIGLALVRLASRANDARMLGLLAAIGGLLAHAMVEFPVEYAYFLLPLGLLMGAAHRFIDDRAITLSRTGLRAGAAVAAAALALTAYDYLNAEQGYRLLRLESARVGTTGLETPPPDLIVLTQLAAFQRFAHAEPRGGLSTEQLAFSRRVAARFAYPSAQYRHAITAGLNGQPAEASHVLATLCRMHPLARCEEAIDGLLAEQSRHPVLREVTPPRLPDR